ncbi:MAG TPA: Xaa-Pro peptidase family protein [Hyphomicrobiaceae bacterium]|nr:Xaa-Pro peptidase family protein [Hyphomicrobiaceae bacterium]
MTSLASVSKGTPPFKTDELDRQMVAAGLDIIVATSRHNVQYLLGGYRFFFFETMEAMGTSRYLPAVIYRCGRPAETVYVGCGMESFERDNGRLWPQTLDLGATGSEATARQVVGHIERLGGEGASIGLELPFIPADAAHVIRQGLARSTVLDATVPLERLRAVKTPAEIGMLRHASEQVVDAILATFRAVKPGQTKSEISDRLRREEVQRGLVFDYCLITAGTSLNRAPSPQAIKAGDIISLDSGANNNGYIGDLCRMGILGRPDSELVDLLALVEEVQQAARRVVRAGTRGGEVVAVGEAMVKRSPHAAYTHYMAHGMGLVSHEAPRLATMPRFSYSGDDASKPLAAGMVLSIETTMAHPRCGFIKLEDTILVTKDGHEALGDGARGWNVIPL